MRRQGLRGVMRGKVVRITVSDSKAPCPLDRVNQLWVSSSMRTDFVLDALEQALYARQANYYRQLASQVTAVAA